MKINFTEEQNTFRQEIRSWLELNLPKNKLQSLDTKEGFEQHREWEKTLNSGNWSMVTWPKEYGGRALNLIEWLIFEEEYYRAEAPTRVNQNGVFLLGPTLMEYGTDVQKNKFLNAMATGDHVWAQGWSEPGAGSDMAAIRTTAVLEDGEFVVQKGSLARAEYVGERSEKSYYWKLYDKLVEQGILVKSGKLRVFTKSYAFSSTSAAGAVCNGRTTAGPRAWKVKGTKQTYRQWEAASLEEG